MSASNTGPYRQRGGQDHPPFNCSICHFNFPYTYTQDPFKFPDLGAVQNGCILLLRNLPICQNCYIAFEASKPRSFEDEFKRRKKLLEEISTKRTFTPKTSRVVIEQWETFEADLWAWKQAWFNLNISMMGKDTSKDPPPGPIPPRALASKPEGFKGKAVETMETVSQEDENAASEGPELSDAAWNRRFQEEEQAILEWPELDDEALDEMVRNFEGSGKAKAQ